jgi:hypothetical protein
VALLANKVISVLRKRGIVVLAVSVVSALLAAKGVHPNGFFDGPVGGGG